MNESKRLKEYLELLINNEFSDMILSEIIEISSNIKELNDIIESELSYHSLI